MNAIDRAIDGAANALLTTAQKRSLILLARRGYARAQALGTIAETRSFDDWRHREQVLVTERSSLTESTQEDFRPLYAHFASLAGVPLRQSAPSAKSAVSSSSAEQAYVARCKLANECQAATDVIERPESYVVAIAQARFKTPDLKSLTAKQVWGLVFDLRRNAQRRRMKRRGATADVADSTD